MCGIFGYIGQTPGNNGILHSLMLLNTTRGTDSTGLLYNNTVYKSIQPAFEFLTDADVNLNGKSTIVIGHTRKSTFGAHTINNAHPFMFDKDLELSEKRGNIIGVHNGTVSNYKDIAQTYKLDSTIYNMDSKVLYYAVLRNRNILKTYEGAAVLVWYDYNTETMYVWNGANNNTLEREIHYVTTINRNKKVGMYISSERGSLEEVCRVYSDIKAKNIKSFKPNHLTEIKEGVIVKETLYERNNIIVPKNNAIFTNNHTNANYSANNIGFNRNNNNRGSYNYTEKELNFKNNIYDINNKIQGHIGISTQFRYKYKSTHQLLDGLHLLEDVNTGRKRAFYFIQGVMVSKENYDSYLTNRDSVINWCIKTLTLTKDVNYPNWIYTNFDFAEENNPTCKNVKCPITGIEFKVIDGKLIDYNFYIRENTLSLPSSINPEVKVKKMDQLKDTHSDDYGADIDFMEDNEIDLELLELEDQEEFLSLVQFFIDAGEEVLNFKSITLNEYDPVREEMQKIIKKAVEDIQTYMINEI